MLEKYENKFKLYACQCDRFGNMRPLILMNELQGCADSHAENLGVGRSYLVANDIAWVVTHYLVDIIEMPRDGMDLVFTTWPSANDGLRATRDFEVRTSDGRLLVRATSQWILIDMATRRPLRLRDYMERWALVSARAWDRTFEKFPAFESEKTHMMKCRFDDIDVNQHINNAVYVLWATESVGFEYRSQHKLQQMEINFKKEISPDASQVEIDVAIQGDITRHLIKTINGEHASVICRWAKM